MTQSANAHLDPVSYRKSLLADVNNVAAWLDQILSPADVVREFPHLATSVESLANMRWKKRGPRYLKPPGKASHVVYRRLDILRFLDAHTVGTNDDPIDASSASGR